MRKILGLAALLATCIPAFAFEDMTPSEANAALANQSIVLVDIRTPAEWAETGIAKGAVPLDMTAANFQADFLALAAANPNKRIDLICRSGNRSSQLATMIEASGMKNIVNVAGGTNAWLAESLPVVSK